MHYSEWPERDHHSPHGYLYVVEFSSGAVKVGHTTDPRARANSLRIDAQKYGLTLTRWWLSPRHTNHADNERKLLFVAPGLGEKLATEYFRCNFHDLVAAASSLPMKVAPVAPAYLTAGQRRTAAKRAKARELRELGYSISEIVAELNISRGSAHGYVRDVLDPRTVR
jgi:hypothetical protein